MAVTDDVPARAESDDGTESAADPNGDDGADETTR